MRDISKRLTVINTEKKDNTSGSNGQSSGVTYVGLGGGGVGNLKDYLLKSIWDSAWELRTDSQGTEYIFGKLPIVTQYGITMYSGGNVDIPTIAEGLPFDNITIWFNSATGRIEVIGGTGGGTGGGSGEGVSNFWDLNGIPLWITNTKPTYSYSEIQGTPDLSKYALSSDIPSLSGYATEAWVLGKGYALASDLAKYIPIAGVTDITGEKNFTGGLKVNGSPIYYDKSKKYWKLEGDLLVTGGVTMYGNDSDFVASTIMDAILYDDSTLGINAQGQLYVKGSVNGATTLGSLSNVGSWADSVASQDRIMYQAANSSQWVAKNLSDLAVGGVTGDYLPLSGGVLTSSANKILELNTTSQVEVGMRFSMSSVAKGWVGYAPSDGTILYNNASKATFGIKDDGTIHFNNNTVWHAGNDGSGSGLDADLLDGKHYSDIINGNVASATRLQAYQHNSGENVLISGSRTDNTFPRYVYDNGWGLCLRWQEGNGVVHNGTIATLNDNVASATKLQTARTIWGQSFDGTGNVDGDLTANGNITMRTGTAFDASKYLTLTNNAPQYGRIGIHINGSTQDGNDYWGDGGRSIITFRRKYGTATSYAFSYAIQHNLVDNTLGILYGSNVGILLNGSGNVGMGITSPLSRCDINGLLTIRNESSTSKQSSLNLMNTSSDLWQLSARYGTSENGNLNIYYYNGSTWAKPLSINKSGNILVSGGITMYSDIRKKTKLQDVELTLQQIADAPLIEHYYNSDTNKTTHVGSIAQYWAEMNDWFCKKDSEGFYTMEIQNAALASAISVARELVKFETETDRRIKVLEDENKRLKEEVEQLKWNIA